MVYLCECCTYTTDKKFNYDKHLLTKRHRLIEQTQQQATHKQHIVNLNSPIEIEKLTPDFRCKYCDKQFGFKQSMYRHMKYTCTKNKGEVLNDTFKQSETDFERQKQMLHKIIDEQSLMIDKLIRHVEIQGSFKLIQNIQHA
jgi:hypothetical protein